MIRFYDRKLVESNSEDIIIATKHILGGGGYFWDDARNYFRQHVSDLVADIRMLPVVNGEQEVVCYAYQDSEANRELRMVKELGKIEKALQFNDIFPDVKEVIVCGCNELAYHFVKYLEKQRVHVAVMGEYWDYFGYDGGRYISPDGAGKMVIYAEGTLPKTDDIFQTIIRSASPEFECIDKIYEANVLEGRIKDAEGSVEWLLEKLGGKEVVILGTDVGAQDAYDFLYEHGIDICCFADWDDRVKASRRTALLGKKVVGVEECINSKTDAVFVSNSDKNSALGTAGVEFFDYYGYGRNEKFFLLRDYAEVPCTNLIHVLKGKKVFFAGDEAICAMVSDYLKEKERGEIYTEYVELSRISEIGETGILCAVNPWYGRGYERDNPNAWRFQETLQRGKTIFYTDYFSQTHTLVNIDLDRNKGKDKYSIKELRPKGILLGRIPGFSGNFFFHGILDGHPNILKYGYVWLNENLFLCCIRLAGEKAGEVWTAFERMCREEPMLRLHSGIDCWDKFEKSAKFLLSLKESFTSQELFVIFHIAYEEMMCGYRVIDLEQKIIYWEPHNASRGDFPFLAQWLDDGNIHGQTVFMHRDMVVRTGSMYRRSIDAHIIHINPISTGIETDDITYQHWEEFHMRFEDIKLHPQRELRRLCTRIGIPWSDTMLRVTHNGQIYDYNGIFDFDLKPVFNKYEECLSGFDRYKISIISSPHQKKYGYTYEDCMKFSRRELQEMFLKSFRFQKEMLFWSNLDKKAYFIRRDKELLNMLWEVRKHTLLNDIVPEFGEVEIGEPIIEQKKAPIPTNKERVTLLNFVREQERLVLYGIGQDCEGLLEYLSDEERSKLVFCDSKAEHMEIFFNGRKVIKPSELCGNFKDYKILITSSQFYKEILQKLEDMGIERGRIVCNTFQLWW